MTVALERAAVCVSHAGPAAVTQCYGGAAHLSAVPHSPDLPGHVLQQAGGPALLDWQQQAATPQATQFGEEESVSSVDPSVTCVSSTSIVIPAGGLCLHMLSCGASSVDIFDMVSVADIHSAVRPPLYPHPLGVHS